MNKKYDEIITKFNKVYNEVQYQLEYIPNSENLYSQLSRKKKGQIAITCFEAEHDDLLYYVDLENIVWDLVTYGKEDRPEESLQIARKLLSIFDEQSKIIKANFKI